MPMTVSLICRPLKHGKNTAKENKRRSRKEIMAKRPTQADADFLKVVGSKLNTKKANKQIDSGVPKPGARDYIVKLAATNHGNDLALLKVNEMLGNEDKIREAPGWCGKIAAKQ